MNDSIKDLFELAEFDPDREIKMTPEMENLYKKYSRPFSMKNDSSEYSVWHIRFKINEENWLFSILFKLNLLVKYSF